MTELSEAEAAVVARFEREPAAPESYRDVRAWLDDLDAALTSLPRGDGPPWNVEPPGSPRVADMDARGVAATGSPAEAALIVAAVNALPELTARLRAVLDLADELDAGTSVGLLRTWVADRIRAAAEGATR